MSIRDCLCPCWVKPVKVRLDEPLIENDPFKKDLAELQAQIERAKDVQNPTDRLRFINALNEFTTKHTPVD